MLKLFSWTRSFGTTTIKILLLMSSLLGLGLSVYSYVVEMKLEENEDYKAMCDINEYASCTRVFSSEYGRGFGIIGKTFGDNSSLNQPNSVYGIFYYVLLILLGLSKSKILAVFLLAFTLLSNLMSVYLAYILFFILNDFCLVCVSLYIVNFIILSLAVQKFRLLFMHFEKKRA